jgi:hypothetical protein
MVPDAEQVSAEYRAIAGRRPGGAITCPYCQQAVEYELNGEDLVQSNTPPMRFSRQKTEDRARSYGQVFLNKADTTPEEWVTHDKGMAGALKGYRYAEDP